MKYYKEVECCLVCNNCYIHDDYEEDDEYFCNAKKDMPKPIFSLECDAEALISASKQEQKEWKQWSSNNHVEANGHCILFKQ